VAAGRGNIAVSVDAHPNYGTLATISITGGDEDLVSIINDAVGGYPLRTAIVRS